MGILSNTPIFTFTDVQTSLVSAAEKFKLEGFAAALNEQFGHPDNFRNMSFEERLKNCFASESEVQISKRFKRLCQKSYLPRKVWFSSLNLPETVIHPNDLLKLSELKFLVNKRNVVLMGKTGVGKTSLAIATAVAAMEKGYSAVFYRMNELVAQIDGRDREAIGKLKMKLKNIHLLVIDDYGLDELNDQVVYGLNEIADARYNIGSTIFTTQLNRKGLTAVKDKAFVYDSLFDKLFNDSGVYIQISGESKRGKAGEARGEGKE